MSRCADPRLTDVDRLRWAMPNPRHRLIWLLGFTTATTAGFGAAAARASASLQAFADAYHQEPQENPE